MAGARGKGALIYLAGHVISFGNNKHRFKVSELSTINKSITWITQISYAQNVIKYQVAI